MEEAGLCCTDKKLINGACRRLAEEADSRGIRKKTPQKNCGALYGSDLY